MIDVNIDSDGIAVLTWDMPGRSMNVINRDSHAAFESAIDRVLSDSSIVGAVITSGKSAFVAGADLAAVKEMMEGPKDPAVLYEMVGSLGHLLRKIETGGKPFVAAINGTALGGGYEIALACHHRVCGDHPKIQIGLPEVKVGLLPGAGGTQRLPRMIGIQAAMMPLLQGQTFNPEMALGMGMVDQVVPADQLISASKAWLKTKPSAVKPWDEKTFRFPGGDPTHPKMKPFFMGASAMIRKETYGNFPAPKAILSCVNEGCRLPIDKGLSLEKRYFVQLLVDPTAANLVRTMFLSMQEANKLARRPKDVPPYQIKKIGVIGAGLMGAGIANTAAKRGIEVVLIDREQQYADKGKEHAAKLQDRSISKGRSTPEKKAAILDRIQATTDYGELASCDFVVEAVFENRDIKASVTEGAEAVIADTAVMGSNTSTLPITGLAEASCRPENFIGVHFFSPVERMPLIEIIRGEATSDATLAKTMDFVKALGKTPIVVNDSRGFYTSRVFGTYVTEGLAMLAEGVAPALIENAGKMAGMPMPPLGLADEVGLYLMHSVGEATRRDLGDDYQDNPGTPILDKMVVELERLGRSKNGKGFYEYDGRNKALWSELASHFPAAAEQPSVDELKKRFLYTQAVETAKVMAEGIVEVPQDADVGAILGWGFAPWTGGPLSYIDTVGAAAFVSEADRLADTYGDRFRVPDQLREMAASNKRFYA